MSTREPTPEQLPGDANREVDDLLASPELAKAVEQEEFKAFLDCLPIGVAAARVARERECVVYANKAFESLTGLSCAELNGRGWPALDALIHEDDPTVKLGRMVSVGEDLLGAFRTEGPDGDPVLVQAYSGLIDDEDSGRSYRIVALVDVTEHDRGQREALERTIRDKDLLLREIQHRVKNNLQLLVVLVRLEARIAQRGEPVDLDRLSSRIEALSLLYDALSLEPSGREVDLGHYLAQVAAAAMRAHATDAIEIDVRVNYCPVSVNVAMPAGFLVNELLTNAFKHAFQGREGGCIAVECVQDEDSRIRVAVADDGIGLPPGVTWPAPDKLGAFVLQTLSENVPLECEVDSAPGRGTRVTLRFLSPATGTKPN